MNYTDAELVRLLGEIESDLAERKESWHGDAPDKGRQAVCAFANDLPDHRRPGVLFIGVNNDGRPTGLAITDELLQTLSDLKTDGNILPPPTLLVQKRRLKGKDVAVVIVQPADAPPVRYRGRIWIRIGPRRGIATIQDERILNEKRRYQDTAFEMHPVASAGILELNKVLFLERYLPAAFSEEAIAEDKRTYAQQLAACGMIEAADSPIPTVLGLIAIGKRPRFFVGGAYVQFLRLKGTSLSDPIIDEALIEGDLEHVVRRIDEKLDSHNRVSIDIVSKPVEQRRYLYPMAALQQLVRNALMHRTYENTNAPVHVYWYDDRIEIRSPGGPFGAVNPQNFGQPGVVDYRNPRIADAMKVLGLVQRFGVGIQTAQTEMKRNGSPAIEFRTDQSAVVCVVHPVDEPASAPDEPVNEPDAPANAPANAPVNAPAKLSLTDLQLVLLKEIVRDQAVSYDELAAITKRNRTTVMRNIKKMKDAGILKRVGSDKTGRWVIVDKQHPGADQSAKRG